MAIGQGKDEACDEMRQTSKTTFSSRVKRMLGLDLDGWNTAMVAFLALAAVSATAVGVSQFIIIKLQKASETETKGEFERYKLEAAEKISEANSRASEAELKLAQLDKKITQRVINDEQAEYIIKVLKPFPEMPFSIEADPAAEYGFINRLTAVLQRSGWKMKQYSVAPSTLPLAALGLDIPESRISGVTIRINRSRLDLLSPHKNSRWR
jgi:biopolymer transport protein ExbD